jgi:hypothetical protein
LTVSLGEKGSKMETIELMRDAIDIHIHTGPDPNRRRRVNAYEAAIQAREAGMRAIVLKSHEYVTTPLAYTIQELVPEIEIYGGTSLNVEVRAIGPKHCIMSTDCEQILNPPPVEGMRMFTETTLGYDITEDEITTMVSKNPAKVLALPES